MMKPNAKQTHFAMTAFWVCAIIPTVIWWKDSILWVALMSLWANIASHLAAYAAAKAEDEIKKEVAK